MPIISVPVGGQARAIHVQQIINWLRGLPSYSEPVSLTGLVSSSYSLTIANGGTGGKGLLVKNSDSSVNLFDVQNSGITVKSHSANQSVFRVRNFADTDNLFEVTTSGVTIGGSGLITESSTSNLTNKTITGGILANNRVSDYLDITQQSPDLSSNPAASRLRLYSNVGSDTLKFRTTAGIVSTLVDVESPQTLLQKSLTGPNISDPTFTSAPRFVTTTNPVSNPAAGSMFVYNVANSLRLMDSTGTVRNVATQEGTETLTNKTISSSTISSGTTLAGPTISNYVGISWASNPGGAASTSRVWGDSSGNLYITPASGIPSTILTSSNTSIASSLSFARTLSLGGL